LSGSRLAIAFHRVRIDCSCIFIVRMNMDEANTIRNKNLLFENAEKKPFLFIEKCLAIRSHRSILQVEYFIKIMTPCGGKKMMAPVVRDATFDTLVQVIDDIG
jgi:hypothetical protein